MSTRVQSIMTRDLVVATENESVATAISRLSDRDVGALLLLCGGRVCGILSERDVLRRVLARGRDPHATRVGEVATVDPITVGEGDSIRKCSELIRSHRFRHLPVIDSDRRPVGIISARDLLQFVVEGRERTLDRQPAAAARSDQSIDAYEAPDSAVGPSAVLPGTQPR